MSKEKSKKLIVVRNGKPRCILSVVERKQSDLIIDLRAKGLADDIGKPFMTEEQYRGEPIHEHRYTIHMSSNSPRKINTIKLHYVFENGQSLKAFQYTSAIKRDHNFAPIYARFCTAMEDPYYDIDLSKNECVSLGDMCKELTLVFAIFISAADREFVGSGKDFQWKQIKFKEFSVLILWSFLSMPSHGHSRHAHVMTSSNYTETKGYDDERTIQIFDFFRQDLKRQYVEIAERESGLTQAMPWIRNSIYLKDPNLQTDEIETWRKYVSQLISSRRLPRRNELCFCGSAARYKSCHGKITQTLPI